MLALREFEYEADEEGANLHLKITFPDRDVSFTISAWSDFIDEYEENPSPSTGYCITSEDGTWIDSGLLRCGIVRDKLILECEPEAAEKLGFTSHQEIELHLSEQGAASLWQRLLATFQRPGLPTISMEFKS